ncbi:hypothetical protein B0H13DRAFT_2313456 [Mycena leptocephala]|nr:hypothetical protein B0H13DRAFT_2313456 [Mycena leptocephala]
MSFRFEDWLRSIDLSPGKLLVNSRRFSGFLRFEISQNIDLKVAVAYVLDIFATIDPSKIIAKIKHHLLVHTDEDVIQFGPLVGVATEIFESFNGLGDQEGLKHRITGGFWPSGVDGKWERENGSKASIRYPIFWRFSPLRSDPM